ncbi:MFS transporter [Zalerion maritima]|uniref:MFS transporter n=1 Tax=Zalerion maritima TaxID=339359 RepID=A0AAD5RKC5_9PEZI|nr:MFS transporter [Zalerion maritima]
MSNIHPAVISGVMVRAVTPSSKTSGSLPGVSCRRFRPGRLQRNCLSRLGWGEARLLRTHPFVVVGHGPLPPASWWLECLTPDSIYPTAVVYLPSLYPRCGLAARVAVFYGQYARSGGRIFCGPGTAWFLTKHERFTASERMRRDNGAYVVKHEYSPSGVEEDKLSQRDVVETVRDWKLCAHRPARNGARALAGGRVRRFVHPAVRGLRACAAGDGVATWQATRRNRGSEPSCLGGQRIRQPGGSHREPVVPGLVRGGGGGGGGYRPPFYASLGAGGILGLSPDAGMGEPAARAGRLERMTDAEREAERLSHARYADRKLMFVYGL